jgi:hypothetical protein
MKMLFLKDISVNLDHLVGIHKEKDGSTSITVIKDGEEIVYTTVDSYRNVIEQLSVALGIREI